MADKKHVNGRNQPTLITGSPLNGDATKRHTGGSLSVGGVNLIEDLEPIYNKVEGLPALRVHRCQDTMSDDAVPDDSITSQSVRSQSQRVSRVLPLSTRFGYSVGHVLNDLCASMWFTYLLVYMHSVRNFSNTLAGGLLLVGQIADAAATPFVGFEADRTDDFWLCKYGRRKMWHLVGTLCVLLTFPFLFMNCLGCSHSHQMAIFVYYAVLISIFQFGWASVQISHLSLIPDLTPFSSERVGLNALRYAATVASNIAVYSITWAVLGLSTNEGGSNRITPSDAPHFRNIVLIVVVTGSVFSLIFHLVVREPSHLRGANLTVSQSVAGDDYDIHLERATHLRWHEWFRVPQFYQVALLYMGTRLYVNLTQVYVPMFLQDTLELNRESIAVIPLVMYVSGFCAAFCIKRLNKKTGKKIAYLLGGCVAVGGAVWLYIGEASTAFRQEEIYAVAVLMGVAGSIMLVTSLAITNDLIGHNVSSGAFVFGCMSFIDKLSNGIAVFTIQSLHPCSHCCPHCSQYYKYVLSFVCGGAACLALLALASFGPKPIEARNHRGLSSINRACINDDVEEREDPDDPKSPLLANETQTAQRAARLDTT